MFTITWKMAGNNEPSIVDSDSYDKLMRLREVLMLFPADVMYIKVYKDTVDANGEPDIQYVYDWTSPRWE